MAPVGGARGGPWPHPSEPEPWNRRDVPVRFSTTPAGRHRRDVSLPRLSTFPILPPGPRGSRSGSRSGDAMPPADPALRRDVPTLVACRRRAETGWERLYGSARAFRQRRNRGPDGSDPGPDGPDRGPDESLPHPHRQPLPQLLEPTHPLGRRRAPPPRLFELLRIDRLEELVAPVLGPPEVDLEGGRAGEGDRLVDAAEELRVLGALAEVVHQDTEGLLQRVG